MIDLTLAFHQHTPRWCLAWCESRKPAVTTRGARIIKLSCDKRGQVQPEMDTPMELNPPQFVYLLGWRLQERPYAQFVVSKSASRKHLRGLRYVLVKVMNYTFLRSFSYFDFAFRYDSWLLVSRALRSAYSLSFLWGCRGRECSFRSLFCKLYVTVISRCLHIQ